MDLTPQARDNFDIAKIFHVRNLHCHHLANENELRELLISLPDLLTTADLNTHMSFERETCL